MEPLTGPKQNRRWQKQCEKATSESYTVYLPEREILPILSGNSYVWINDNFPTRRRTRTWLFPGSWDKHISTRLWSAFPTWEVFYPLIIIASLLRPLFQTPQPIYSPSRVRALNVRSVEILNDPGSVIFEYLHFKFFRRASSVAGSKGNRIMDASRPTILLYLTTSWGLRRQSSAFKSMGSFTAVAFETDTLPPYFVQSSVARRTTQSSILVSWTREGNTYSLSSFFVPFLISNAFQT